jgi:hypothetical protein
MTAVATLSGALSHRMTVRGLQARMVQGVSQHVLEWDYSVPQGALARLELLEGKLSRAVLRGLSGSNLARLPGDEETYRKATRLVPTHLSNRESLQLPVT